jgi:ppGpp synthetase/RelA/SpoT-type nucleotidyltranferase
LNKYLKGVAVDMNDNNKFSEEYQKNFEGLNRLRLAIVEQLSSILQRHHISLAIPVESRVKSLVSISEKVDRKRKAFVSIFEFDDVVGVRVILLFNRDVKKAKSLIEKTFDVCSSEDTSDRLGEVQFGYQSQHYVVKLPKVWLDVPTFVGLGDMKVELQVRTLAQHIWATASHKLQYKQEASVPPPLRRAIHRVSALLETVDLEFERVLSSRDEYIDLNSQLSNFDKPINVESLKTLMDDILPAENFREPEEYSDLVQQLLSLGIDSVDRLKDILTSHYDWVEKFDSEKVEEKSLSGHFFGTSEERIKKGVFLTHVGWVRKALARELGQDVLLNSTSKLNKNK